MIWQIKYMLASSFDSPESYLILAFLKVLLLIQETVELLLLVARSLGSFLELRERASYKYRKLDMVGYCYKYKGS